MEKQAAADEHQRQQFTNHVQRLFAPFSRAFFTRLQHNIVIIIGMVRKKYERSQADSCLSTIHGGSEQPRIGTWVLGFLLICLSALLIHSLTPHCLLRSLCSFVRELRGSHSLDPSLTYSQNRTVLNHSAISFQTTFRSIKFSAMNK